MPVVLVLNTNALFLIGHAKAPSAYLATLALFVHDSELSATNNLNVSHNLIKISSLRQKIISHSYLSRLGRQQFSLFSYKIGMG